MERCKAIVTLACGERFRNTWKKVCEANWQTYADKHGYDLICIDSPLDSSDRAQRRSSGWQKCLILNQDFIRHYERVVWVDADILINTASAPCIAAGVPVDKVGAVEVWSQPTPQLFEQTLHRMYEFWGSPAVASHTAKEYYANHGLPPDFDHVVQTGVMVLSPRYHRALLEKTYFDYEEEGGPYSNYEQPALSYELLRNETIHWIDHRFNVSWNFEKIMHYPFLVNLESRPSCVARIGRKLAAFGGSSSNDKVKRACVTAAFLRSFFLHFTASLSEMTLVDWKATSWRGCRV